MGILQLAAFLGNIASGGTGGYESDDESPFQAAIEESIRSQAAEPKSASAVPKGGDTSKKPTVPSKFGTIGGLHKDDEGSSEEEGQAYYAGGSERSGQQIIGPPKAKENDKKVTKIFEAARKQGAMEADDDDEDGPPAQAKKEKAFGGVGYTLGDEKTPSRPLGQATAKPAATAQAEQVPLRFYANGFTIGDGELRSFEENKEFMDHIKRGEVPPELRNLSAGGKQVEVNITRVIACTGMTHIYLLPSQVRLEDHRGEDYKQVAPTFKPFGGAGHMLGSPAPNITSSATTTQSSLKASTGAAPTSTDTNRLEELAQQRLKSSSSSTTLRLRLPDLSTPVRIDIDLNRTLVDVRAFLQENVSSLSGSQFEFIEPPASKIKREDETKTISDAKLTNATLAIRRVT